MYFKLFLLLLLWFEWVNLSILILFINVVINRFGKILFAGLCSNFAEKYNEMADSFKIELFKDLNDMKKGEKLSILEVGAGSGANFKYYNRSALVQAVEPNHNFESRFNENRAKYLRKHVQKQRQENATPLEQNERNQAAITKAPKNAHTSRTKH